MNLHSFRQRSILVCKFVPPVFAGYSEFGRFRMCIAEPSSRELGEYLKFKLAPFTLALFDEKGMRKATKSFLYKAFACTKQF